MGCHVLLPLTALCENASLWSVISVAAARHGSELHWVTQAPWPWQGCDPWRDHNAFELWCWRRLLKVHWTARRSNQSVLKEINPKYSLEGLMLKLKLQYCGHLMQRANSRKELDAEGKRRGWAEDEMAGWHHWFNGHESEQTPGDSGGQRSLACCSPWGSQRVEHDLVIEYQNEESYLSWS